MEYRKAKHGLSFNIVKVQLWLKGIVEDKVSLLLDDGAERWRVNGMKAYSYILPFLI